MIRTATTIHGPLQVYDNDHIGKILLEGTYYEQDLISIALNNTDKNGIALDIGAHVGCHSIVYANHFRSVHAFEAQQHLYQLLKQNLREHKGSKAYNLAIGHTAGECFINNTVKSGEEQNYGSRSIKLNGMNKVEMRTVDSFGFENVRLIKVDVEGAEKLVIYGARETIARNKPTLLFENDKVDEFMDKFHVYLDEIRKFEIMKFLKEIGYSKFMPFSKNILALCSV